MKTADHLNFDVLVIIFSYLNANDFASVALVSKSFLAAVTPWLYRSLRFHVAQAKGYPKVMTPFQAVLARPEFPVYVRAIDIRVIPNTVTKMSPDVRFLKDAAAAVGASQNIRSFTCTLYRAVPSFLAPLQGKENLQHLRISANLTPVQSDLLIKLKGLKSLFLENASWSVLDALPRWAKVLEPTLSHLTIQMTHDLNEGILKETTAQLPNLLGLHIIACPRVHDFSVLSATASLRHLQSLAFSITEPAKQLPEVYLHELRHLAIDLAPSCLAASSHSAEEVLTLTRMLQLTRFTQLSSLALRSSGRQELPFEVLDDILERHGKHLRALRLMCVALDTDMVYDVAERCEKLEKLVMAIPVTEIDQFTEALTCSDSLTTLIDVTDHGVHGHRRSLLTEPVRELMEDVPSLQRVVSSNRYWTVCFAVVSASFRAFEG
ncbi:hypothetical protein OF83DRAFT_1153092 [Amylostereum chailletii]|nr:hypothetical protein OF83DRAFT_1153092 [Amylostereum chailletii]